MNTALRWVQEHGGMGCWSGRCIMLALHVCQARGGSVLVARLDKGTLHPACYDDEPENCTVWDYHAAPLIGGQVHDAWHPGLVLPARRWARLAFPRQWRRVRLAHLTMPRIAWAARQVLRCMPRGRMAPWTEMRALLDRVGSERDREAHRMAATAMWYDNQIYRSRNDYVMLHSDAEGLDRFLLPPA